MNRFATVLTAAALTLAWHTAVAADTCVDRPGAQLDRCNVTWTSPSRDSSGSMPLGNGDIGLNLWVEPDRDLLCYLSKTDAWCGTGRLLKVGRLRVSLDPNPFRAGLPFRQTLRLREGEIEIVAGAEDQAVTLHIWVELAAAGRACPGRGGQRSGHAGEAGGLAERTSRVEWHGKGQCLRDERQPCTVGRRGGHDPASAPEPRHLVPPQPDQLLSDHAPGAGSRRSDRAFPRPAAPPDLRRVHRRRGVGPRKQPDAAFGPA